MGRRETIIISSSSDEEEMDPSYNSNRTGTKSKSHPRPNPRPPKKPRLLASLLSPEPNNADTMRLFCEDFEESFTGFKVLNGGEKSSMKELWVDKYKPRSLEELAVHKKKVEEVKLWFEERLRMSREENVNQVLIISGQAGVGKSATVQVIASHFGATLCEWNTPTPTIWQEHVHNINSGIRYTSKLDEFENFVERIRKYGTISSSFGGQSKSSVILIDDLPVASGRVAYGKLHSCLQILVQSTSVPAVILITDYGKVDSADSPSRYLEDLQSSLESIGACKVSFNPITTISIKKTLSGICRQERCTVTADQIDLIAKASGGDIRHAISSLQYFCLRPDQMPPLFVSNCTLANSRKLSNEVNLGDNGLSLPFGRDETLSLFHALGKFLHNKREIEADVPSVDQHAFFVSERLTRLPFKMDAPEKILCQAHGQARPITDFLHENVLDFLSEEAIDDAWTIASYLSDADVFLGALHAMMSKNHEAENIAQSTAASVASRGVLFGNSHALSSRWHSIRRPKLWQVEQSSLHNKYEMAKQRSIVCSVLSSSNIAIVATEYMPTLKWLGYREPEDVEARRISSQGNEMSLNDEESEVSEDDEIEDW